MSDVLERFMRYVQVDSSSDPGNDGVTPSTPCQHDMARVLADDLAAIGCRDVTADEHAYVTGVLDASAGAEGLPALVLCAHIDSSPDAPAHGVRPHVVRYEGGPLVAGVVDGEPVQTTPDQVPDLECFVGQDIVCSDGTTLLSADDKAGVAEIMALLARLSANPELPHPAIKAAFVPDEEIGHGAELLDLEALGARWGYTVDGEALGELNFECFSASEATVRIRGVMVHPGSAKNVMVNAITVAAEYQRMIPAAERPEHTEGREGYYHPTDIEGTASEVTLTYILRDFDAEGFARREKTMHDVAGFLNARYGEGTVSVSIREQYRNMAEKFGPGDRCLVDYALEANREVGIEPVLVPARGGTDGAQLTFRGLPCPNIATGGYNAHSVREFIPVSSLEVTVDLLERLVAKFATGPEAVA
ncbi:peptidase T [Thermophilibacter provencensis]|uniref:Peptidase T n=1 Tax=Thermophilibacter provencensis TaxID=1852386 RepID=A0A921GH72_9ACTN|nr:peptidase T [Thermophilibacter provencensis]HJF46023.1 peptidase T [Thermophilibacter provencensis]